MFDLRTFRRLRQAATWIGEARPAISASKAGANRAVVAQARLAVWGSDDAQLSFVMEWMGKAPLPPLISHEQKAAAIAATRGRAIGASESY